MPSTPSGKPDHPLAIVVTGGAGFLGHAIVDELLHAAERGEVDIEEIRVFDLEPGGHFEDRRVTATQGDIRSYEALREICSGADLVFHAAALVDWGNHPPEKVWEINVTGTENVLRACHESNVPTLVATSTLDVVFDGRPIIDGDESLPYATNHATAYCRTKAESEKLVRDADGRALAGGGTLRTTVIRPLSMYGERDPFHLPGLIRSAGRLPIMRIGNGKARCQHVYVRNVAYAHWLAARSLLSADPVAAGQVYFAADSRPANFFDFLEPLAGALGYRMVPWRLAIPRSVMLGVAAANTWAAALVRPVYRFTPVVTRFAVDFVCLDFTFSDAKARRELGYEPIYGEQEAFDRTVAWFREHPPT
jgi:nucleoside-diphosphate-sugar epimerase